MNQSHDDVPGGRNLTTLNPASLSPGNDEKQRLLMQTLSEAQVDFLMQRTPQREVKYRQGRGGLKFAYVEHGYVTERLNLVFGFNWDFEIVDKQILDDEVIVEARLTVRTPGGQTIVKTQFGGAEIKRHVTGQRTGRPLSIADDYKAAASDALKKCASLLGIGLDLYGRDRPDDAPDGVVQSPGRPKVVDIVPPPGEAASPRTGMCTAQQALQIGDLAREAGLQLDDLCASLGIRSVSQLTEARAQRVISRLQELAHDTSEDAS